LTGSLVTTVFVIRSTRLAKNTDKCSMIAEIYLADQLNYYEPRN